VIRSARPNSSDERIRALERQLAQGDPSAAGALAIAYYRSTGTIDPSWVESLLRTPAGVAVDQVMRQAGLVSQLYDAYGRILYARLESDGFMGGRQIQLPDPFGRPTGMSLTARQHAPEPRGRAHSQYTFRHLPDDAAAADRVLDREPQPWISITAVLLYDSSVHPWYFHLYPNVGRAYPEEIEAGAAHPDMPNRYGRDSILLSELEAGGAAAFAECAEFALKGIDQVVDLVNADLTNVRERLGVRTYEDAVRYALGVQGIDSETWKSTHLALLSVTPPSGAPNASGRGEFANVIWTFRRWLDSQRGVRADLATIFPFALDGYPLDSYEIDVRGSRASRSGHPLRVQVNFDALVGLWSRFGDRWRGNAVPPQGEWRIHLYSAIPRSTQDWVQPIVKWIKEHYPQARVLIGNDGGYRVGRYGQPESWREA